MTKKISQQSAIKLKKRVKELETLLSDLKKGWVGTQIATLTFNEVSFARIKTAEMLGHTTIICCGYQGTDVAIKAVKL